MTLDLSNDTHEYNKGEAIERLGGRAAVVDRLNTAHQVFERFNQEQDELVREHPHQWVLMGNQGVLTIKPTLEEVREYIKDNDLKNPYYLVKYLDPNPPVMIL